MDYNRKINQLLAEYKHLINFEEAMEKSNYKFVTGYLKWAERKYKDFEADSIAFLKDAIDVHRNYLKNKQNFQMRNK